MRSSANVHLRSNLPERQMGVLVGEFERCKMRQRLNESPVTFRRAVLVTASARRECAGVCVKGEEPTVSLQRCVKPAGHVSWRAIAQLEAEAFVSSMGQAYNVCHVAHIHADAWYAAFEKKNKSTTRSRPLFMRCTRRGGQFEDQISPRLSRSSILKDTAQQLSLMRPTHFWTSGRTRSKERCARGAIDWP